MDELIVSDTGPLITLEKLSDGYSFIRKLYKKILIPQAVMLELAQGSFENTLAYLNHYEVEDLFEIREVLSNITLPGLEILDRGEREAIILAQSEGLPLLIEENEGRQLAKRNGIEISGIAGQILKTVRTGVLNTHEAKFKMNELLEHGRINSIVFKGIIAALEKEV